MTTSFRRILLAGTVAAGLAVPGTLIAAEFSDEQRSEMGEIIRDYLLKNPEVLRDALHELQRREEVAEAERAQKALADNAANIYRSEHDLVVGNPEGSITMVEYFDYNCGYCKRALPDVLKLIDEDKDLRVVLKEFPILGPGSTFAARAALASRKQGKYWEFHLAMLGQRGTIDEGKVLAAAEKVGLDTEKLKADMEAPEVDEAISINMSVARQLGINGTPAFIIGERVVPGAVGYRSLAGTVAEVRESGGCKIC
jgi:protein-disulfide isomerase